MLFKRCENTYDEKMFLIAKCSFRVVMLFKCCENTYCIV